MSADSSQHESVLEITFRRRDRLPLEVEVLRVEELLQRPEVDPARPSRADFHTFLLVEEGTSFHLVDFERYRIGPGDLLVIPERHVQAFDPACVMNGYMALFTARFLELLEVRFPAEHQASSYARALHTSLRTLDRHLMDARGQTARQAISSRLVLEAKRLLTRPDVLVKNIAYELGFSEPQNFTRFFRSQTGLSPEAFRTSLDR